MRSGFAQSHHHLNLMNLNQINEMQSRSVETLEQVGLGDRLDYYPDD